MSLVHVFDLGNVLIFVHEERFLDTLRARCRVFSHEVGVRKPDRPIFRHVESLSGRPAEEHVFVDDLPEHVAGARAAGWQAIQFRGVEDCRRRLAALGGG